MLLRACALAGDDVKAESWFQEMRKNCGELSFQRYQAVIRVLAKAGDLEGIRRRVVDMRISGSVPFHAVFSDVVITAALEGHLELAEEACRWMASMKCRLSETHISKLRQQIQTRSLSRLLAIINSGRSGGKRRARQQPQINFMLKEGDKFSF